MGTVTIVYNFTCDAATFFTSVTFIAFITFSAGVTFFTFVAGCTSCAGVTFSTSCTVFNDGSSGVTVTVF